MISTLVSPALFTESSHCILYHVTACIYIASMFPYIYFLFHSLQFTESCASDVRVRCESGASQVRVRCESGASQVRVRCESCT